MQRTTVGLIVLLALSILVAPLASAGDVPTRRRLCGQDPQRHHTGFLNVKTAEALGITLPPALLRLADEVIK